MNKLLPILFMIPLTAWATNKPKPPATVEKPVPVYQECKSCKRDRIGYILLGVGVTVFAYEMHKRRVEVKQTADMTSVQFMYQF